jgi:hypothetical protein
MPTHTGCSLMLHPMLCWFRTLSGGARCGGGRVASHRLRVLLAVVAAVLLGSAWVPRHAHAGDVSFDRDVLPILSDTCFACHGPDASGDVELRLDSFEAATADRGGYRAIDPENPHESVLLARIDSTDDPMPPEDFEKQLSEEQKQVLRTWVEQGGGYEQHWAFQKPSRGALADAAVDGSGVIDAAIAKQLTEQGVGFAAEADHHTLARRAALTLTGLPPDPEQLAAFLADTSEDAYERYLDELLASPRYGEHMARFWLDAVRYGDTHGLHLDNRRGIYPYRDWVVRAFNENLPLDTFITWQLAGDLLPEPTLEQQIATGFVRLNPTTSEGGVIPEEFQAKNNFDRTETLGTALLGMTLTCARCHTHKYDPVTHTEYYQLLAFFNSTAEPPLDRNAYAFGPTVRVPEDQAAWAGWQQLERERASIAAVARSFVEAGIVGLQGEDRSRWPQLAERDMVGIVARPTGPFAAEPLGLEARELLARIDAADRAFTTTLVAEELPEPRPTRRLHRGEYDQPSGDPLEPGVPAVLGELPAGVPRNRLGLAAWLVAPEQPLVSRVLANRLWQQVFGAGLVRTPEDFGVQGRRPTHPELLDWLAVELQESGWDMKRFLRMMLASRTFRQSSATRQDLDDPENLLVARGPRYRLDAEVLRDLGLWSSGLLDPTMGGEGVKPYQPAGMWEAMAHPASNTKAYVPDTGQRLYRRSLYVYWKRTSPHPMMTLFDAPDRESACVRRSRTSTPLQSLGMFNETQRVEMARELAERLLREYASDEARLSAIFDLLMSRPAEAVEAAACQTLLDQMKQRFAADAAAADSLLAVGEATRDAALPAAEVAAWTQLAVTLLASDAATLLY